jgi:NADH-quinone oxidoreductase subunit C
MDFAALAESLKQQIPSVSIESAPSLDLHETIYLAAEDFPQAALALRDRPDLRFSLLAELTAIDQLPAEPRFELVYLLVSIEHRQRLRVRVRLAGSNPHIATVSSVWPAANWLEREVWDLFGIAFDGHPDPRRLLMPEDWEGYPLRKDYPVQIQMTPKSSEPLQVSEQEFRANVERDRLTRGQ